MRIDDFLSELDTNRFGYRVAKINNFDFSIEETLNFLKDNQFRVVISKIEASNISLLNEMEKNGFLVKDFQLTYKFDLKEEFVNFKLNPKVTVRSHIPSDIEKLSEIAIHSFLDYGHYTNNSMFDLKEIPFIYEDWLRRSCLDKDVADQVFVAEFESEIVGFFCVKTAVNLGQKYAFGCLAAVKNSHRNLNVMQSLFLSSLMWGRKNNLSWMENNVLATNLPINKAIVKAGFSLSKSTITLHKNL